MVGWHPAGPILDIGLRRTGGLGGGLPSSGFGGGGHGGGDDGDDDGDDDAASDDGGGVHGGGGESRWTTLAAWADADAQEVAPFVDAYARCRNRRGSKVWGADTR